MKLTRVAAAVILKPDGRFLLAQRPEGKPYPGYWEFPGGKIERGESAYDALVRELKEELDITITDATPWLTRVHAYTHATVHLAFFRVTGWRGEPRGLEGQAHVWQSIRALDVAPMLPANSPIFRALHVPTRMAISPGWADATWTRHAAEWLRDQSGIVQLREKTWVNDLERVLATGHALLDGAATTHAAGENRQTPASAVVVNSDMVQSNASSLEPLWQRGAGLHMTAHTLAVTGARPHYLASAALWGASCHTRDELLHAVNIGVDYAVVGPVNATRSHPDQPGIGWAAFSTLCAELPLPVFAVGGLAAADDALARQHGAHGVAALSRAFA